MDKDSMEQIAEELKKQPYIKRMRRFFFWYRIAHPYRMFMLTHVLENYEDMHGEWGWWFRKNQPTIKFLRKSRKICQWMTRLEMKWLVNGRWM